MIVVVPMMLLLGVLTMVSTIIIVMIFTLLLLLLRRLFGCLRIALPFGRLILAACRIVPSCGLTAFV